MFTILIHHPPQSNVPPSGPQAGLGAEELLPNCNQVVRHYETGLPDATMPGLHLSFADRGNIILCAGRVYVMNEQGATVQKYILDNSKP